MLMDSCCAISAARAAAADLLAVRAQHIVGAAGLHAPPHGVDAGGSGRQQQRPSNPLTVWVAGG